MGWKNQGKKKLVIWGVGKESGYVSAYDIIFTWYFPGRYCVLPLVAIPQNYNSLLKDGVDFI